jgi:predicted transcriptional regulator
MRSARTISITLPPELLVKAQELARSEHRTISELFREALRHYIALGSSADPEWEALLRKTRTTGRRLGIVSEADVERIADEFRAQKLSANS